MPKTKQSKRNSFPKAKHNKNNRHTIKHKHKFPYSKKQKEYNHVTNEDVLKQLKQQREKEKKEIKDESLNSIQQTSLSSHPKINNQFIYDSERKIDKIWNPLLNVTNKKQTNHSHLFFSNKHSNLFSKSIISTINRLSFYIKPSKRKDIIINMKNKILLHRTKFQPCILPILKNKLNNNHPHKSNHMDNLHLINDHDCESDCVHPLSNHQIKIKVSNTSNHCGWFSMLQPMKKTLSYKQNRKCIPLDCKSKLHLHPSSHTFSILTSNQSDFLPHIATLVRENPETHFADVYYRPPILPKPFWLKPNKQTYKNHMNHDFSNHSNQSHFLSVHSNTNEYNQSIHMIQSNNDDNAFLGLLSYNNQSDIQSFCIRNIGNNINCIKIQMIEKSNDFAFSQSIQKVAFAPINTSKSQTCYPMILDVPTLSIQSALRRHHAHSFFQSDTFCIQIQNDFILYGQRNGYIRILDQRSGTLAYSIQSNFEDHNSSFGSVSSLTVLNPHTTNHPCTFVARGSFGSCHYFDLRHYGSHDNHSIKSSIHSTPDSLVYQMKVPQQEYLDTSATLRCSGVALCPDQIMCVSPYISNNKSNGIISSRLGIWSLLSGKYIGNLPIETNKPNKDNPSDSIKLYCELSSIVTGAWDMKRYFCNKKNENEISCYIHKHQKSWGLWLKSGKIDSSIGTYSLPPSQTGSIHHAIFPMD